MDCRHRHLLSAYHDGELDESRAHDLGRHLLTCAACAAALGEIRTLSHAFVEFAATGISPAAAARARGAAAEAAERARSAADNRRLFVRVSGVLTAAAASVLVVASAWLLDPPAPPTGTGAVAAAPAPAADWERIALTLDAGPLTADSPGAPGRLALAAAAGGGDDVRVAEWMVRNLTP